MTGKRKKRPPREVVSKDNYYMMLAFLASTRSPDPGAQWGCHIVGDDETPVAHTCNGPPDSIKSSDIDWGRPEKYDLTFDAEDQAINAGRIYDFSNCTMYVTAMPCRSCMKMIARSHMSRVVYFSSRSVSGSMQDLTNAEKERILSIAKKGNVRLEAFTGNLNWIRDQIALFDAAGIFAQPS